MEELEAKRVAELRSAQNKAEQLFSEVEREASFRRSFAAESGFFEELLHVE
jgi:hypothetical protein